MKTTFIEIFKFILIVAEQFASIVRYNTSKRRASLHEE